MGIEGGLWDQLVWLWHWLLAVVRFFMALLRWLAQ
jgi:hypothetical protein